MDAAHGEVGHGVWGTIWIPRMANSDMGRSGTETDVHAEQGDARRSECLRRSADGEAGHGALTPNTVMKPVTATT
jgi:hypothetical protein